MAGRWLGYKKLGCTAGHRRIVLRTRRASEPFSHIVQLFFFVYLAFMLKMHFVGLGKKFKLLNVN